MNNFEIAVKLNAAEFKGKRLVFNKPIEFIVSKDIFYYYLDIDFYDIHSVAKSIEGLIDDVQEELIFLWESYACEDDKKMTDGGIELKRRLIENVKEFTYERKCSE